MTALKEFDRLEATGLWRPSPETQRREVIVSLGEATLTISDTKGTALAHWSIAATVRSNGSALPAIYHPDGDPGETLEIDGDETAMIDGIDRLAAKLPGGMAQGRPRLPRAAVWSSARIQVGRVTPAACRRWI